MFISIKECQHQHFDYSYLSLNFLSHNYFFFFFFNIPLCPDSDSTENRGKVTVDFNKLYIRTQLQSLRDVQHLAMLAFKTYTHIWFTSILRQEQVHLMMTGLKILSIFCPASPSSRIMSQLTQQFTLKYR